MKRVVVILALPLLTGCPSFLSLSRTGGPSGTNLQQGQDTARPATYDKLPATAQGKAVYAFSDQPAQSNPLDKTVRFAATHFAGTQKMTSEEKARFVAVNPNWVQWHYRLGVASGPADYLHDDKWDSDWNEVTRQDEWFLHNAQGMRSETTAANGAWDMHDLSNPAMREYWLDNVTADLKANNSDGVFADSFIGGIGCALLATNQCDARLQGTNAGDITQWAGGITWLSLLNDWLDTIQTTLHALPGHPLVLPNLDALNTFWAISKLRLSTMDGAFLENFPTANQNGDYVTANTNALALTGADKVVILQTSVDPTSLSQRSFVVGTYLLVKGNRTFLNMMGGTGDTGFYYWPEYDVNLGKPTGTQATDFASLRFGTVYARTFDNGLVLVNASAASASVALPSGQIFYQVIPTGGGAISEAQLAADGEVQGMSLAYQLATSPLSVNAWSGAILVTSQP